MLAERLQSEMMQRDDRIVPPPNLHQSTAGQMHDRVAHHDSLDLLRELPEEMASTWATQLSRNLRPINQNTYISF